MAIDTEDKRRGAISVCWCSMYPVPIGTIEAADRMQAAGFYPVGGATPTTPVQSLEWTVYGVRRVFTVKRDLDSWSAEE